MSRVQLALNVADLDASIEFYTKLFKTEPAKIRDGYANFAIADPPLKLVLFTGMGEPGSLNHIGVEVEDADAVQAMIAHADDLGLDQKVRENTSCCFAVQDKTWVRGPGERLGVLLRQGRRTDDVIRGRRRGLSLECRQRRAGAGDSSGSEVDLLLKQRPPHRQMTVALLERRRLKSRAAPPVITAVVESISTCGASGISAGGSTAQ